MKFSQQLPRQHDDVQAYEIPQKSCAPTEEGILLPLRGWNGNGMYNKTIYFEVAFSPQLLH